MQAKLIKSDDYYVLSIIEQKEFERIFATTNSVLEDKKHKLSIQNCDEIFGIVDVEKLADEYSDKYYDKSSVNWHCNYNGYIGGFNKSVELNKDKLFTIEDMKKCFKAARKEDSYCNLGGWQSELRYSNFKSYAKTIQQPTEIKVEIVYQRDCYSDNFTCGDEDNCISCTQTYPKLDKDG